MKALPVACVFWFIPSLQGTVLPIQQVDQHTVQEFEKYVAKWENGPHAEFARNGRIWIDSQGGGRRRDFDGLKQILEARVSANVLGGHVHHMLGTIRISGATLETVLRTVESYAKYPDFFKPDVSRSEAALQPDSTEQEQHFRIDMELAQATLWFDIALRGIYDAHYRRLDEKRITTSSRSLSLHEYKDAHNRAAGTFPEGQDHGLLWRTYTSWHMRERDGGVDLEVNSIFLTRSIPMGFGWWASRKARESVEKMVDRTRAAILASKPS